MFTAPALRLATMFQGTPFKLAENKVDLIMKALRNETDIYGRSDYNKLIRFIILSGLTYGAGQAVGLDLSKQAGFPFHRPFETETPSGHLTWAVSPPLQDYAKGVEGPKAALKAWGSTWGSAQKYLEDYVPERYDSKLQQILGIPNAGWEEDVQMKEEWKHNKRASSDFAREAHKPGGKIDTPYETLMDLLNLEK